MHFKTYFTSFKLYKSQGFDNPKNLDKCRKGGRRKILSTRLRKSWKSWIWDQYLPEKHEKQFGKSLKLQQESTKPRHPLPLKWVLFERIERPGHKIKGFQTQLRYLWMPKTRSTCFGKFAKIRNSWPIANVIPMAVVGDIVKPQEMIPHTTFSEKTSGFMILEFWL